MDNTAQNMASNLTATFSSCSSELVGSPVPSVTMSSTLESTRTVPSVSAMNTKIHTHPQLSTTSNTIEKCATVISMSTLKLNLPLKIKLPLNIPTIILKSTKSIPLKKRVTFDELMSTVPAHTTEKTSEEKSTMKNAFNQNATHTPYVSSSATLLKNTHCTIVQNNHVHCAPISTSQVTEKNQTVSSALQHHQITQHKSCEDNTKASTSQAKNVNVISDEDENQFDDVIFTKQQKSNFLYKYSLSLKIQGKKLDHWKRLIT